MNIGKEVAAAGVALFCLGGLSVYMLVLPKKAILSAEPAQQHRLQTATEPRIKPAAALSNVSLTNEPIRDTGEKQEMTHAAFLAEAEARREQNLQEKAETERVGKLRLIKQNSVECKFWKQQQKTSSAAAKIDEKINQFCNLPSVSSNSASGNDKPRSEMTNARIAP